MPVRVRSLEQRVQDIPGAGLVFQPNQELEVPYISEALAHAIQAGRVEVVSQEAADRILVAEDGQVSFSLPFPWPGPDLVDLAVGGLIQEFGQDWTVVPESNQLLWLDPDIQLLAGEPLQLIRRFR